MTDILEDAAEYEQHQRDASIKEVRERKAMPFTGRCLICNTPIKKGQLCGADCQNDYDL